MSFRDLFWFLNQIMSIMSFLEDNRKRWWRLILFYIEQKSSISYTRLNQMILVPYSSVAKHQGAL